MTCIFDIIIWRELVSCGLFGLNLVSEQCAFIFTLKSLKEITIAGKSTFSSNSCRPSLVNFFSSFMNFITQLGVGGGGNSIGFRPDICKNDRRTVALLFQNIARGTTDPEIDSVNSISCKFGHQMALLVFVANLTTRWHHLQYLQIWLPDGITCISYKFGHQMAPLRDDSPFQIGWIFG